MPEHRPRSNSVGTTRMRRLLVELERQVAHAEAHEMEMQQFVYEADQGDWLPEHQEVARESLDSARAMAAEVRARLAEGYAIVAAAMRKDLDA